MNLIWDTEPHPTFPVQNCFWLPSAEATGRLAKRTLERTTSMILRQWTYIAPKTDWSCFCLHQCLWDLDIWMCTSPSHLFGPTFSWDYPKQKLHVHGGWYFDLSKEHRQWIWDTELVQYQNNDWLCFGFPWRKLQEMQAVNSRTILCVPRRCVNGDSGAFPAGLFNPPEPESRILPCWYTSVGQHGPVEITEIW